ncbi:ATPase, T2SS/T4P/T4SS family [Vibrio fluvialis]|uniref:ATPase, T2SS/T4P/T4SS family n=1 Tax=Vibrio fluvialis TaxID=676 RepID=UPI00192B86ED|nr:Flp pilus assembly complex ATPase component TadA [Vibrio fluvialis]
MSTLIVDPNLKDIYFRHTERNVAVVVENGKPVVLYSKNVDEITELRNYIKTTESLEGGVFYGVIPAARKVEQSQIDQCFVNFGKDMSGYDNFSEEEKGVLGTKLAEILQEAANCKCSDVHIEVYEDKTLIKFRVYGQRRLFREVPEHAEGRRLASYIFMSKAKEKIADFKARSINEGRIFEKLNIDGELRMTSWRVAWLPATGGGKITMRWVNANSKIPDLETLGFEPGQIAAIEEFKQSDSGLMLFCGKVNAGKTTSIFSILDSLDRSESVHTFEDPPETILRDVIQTHVEPHVKVDESSDEYRDFHYYGKATLRHDPDWEMYGELRDQNTAMQALRKGDTGQKVIASMHTSGVLGIPPALIEHFKVEPSLVASSDLIRVMVYQALVRRVCANCSLDYETWKSQASDEKIRHAENAISHLKLDANEISNLRFKSGCGCSACDHEGEFGRTLLVEMAVIDDEDRVYFQNRDYLGWKHHLYGKGFKDIKDHGVVRLVRGEIDLFTMEKRVGRIVPIETSKRYGEII